MRRIAVFMMSATVAVGLMAGPGVATGGNTKRFCKLNLAVDTSTDAPSRRLLNQLRAAAPSEIADTVDEAVTTFRELGEAAFEDPAFQAAIAELDQYVLDSCGYDTVDVSMQDYSFNGIPSTLKKGVVAFNLTNDGAEVHEMAVVRLKGKTTIDDLLEVPADAPEKAFRKLVQEVPGGGFAFPGESDVALVNLKKPGRYVALCFIPVGTTPDAGEEGGTGPPHFHEGMAAEFEVTT
jgi:hypothetical protein